RRVVLVRRDLGADVHVALRGDAHRGVGMRELELRAERIERHAQSVTRIARFTAPRFPPHYCARKAISVEPPSERTTEPMATRVASAATAPAVTVSSPGDPGRVSRRRISTDRGSLPPSAGSQWTTTSYWKGATTETRRAVPQPSATTTVKRVVLDFLSAPTST